MVQVSFAEIIRKAALVAGMYDLEQNSQQALRELYKFTAEYVREKTEMLPNNPTWSFEDDERTFKQNAAMLLNQANDYFATKIRAGKLEGLLDFEVGNLEPPAATQLEIPMNFGEFNGGMLGFLKCQGEPTQQKLDGIIQDYETLALNAATWAYHFSFRRTPFSYFKL